jgi:hypothetical protein
MDNAPVKLPKPKAKPPAVLHSGFGSVAEARAVQGPKGGAPMVNSPVPGTVNVKKKKKSQGPTKLQTSLASNLMKRM